MTSLQIIILLMLGGYLGAVRLLSRTREVRSLARQIRARRAEMDRSDDPKRTLHERILRVQEARYASLVRSLTGRVLAYMGIIQTDL